jgi:hypothetical protein
MITVRAKGHGGARVFYDRQQKHGTRTYHVFSLTRVVNGEGESYWRLIVFQWAFAWGYDNRRPLVKSFD